MKLKNGLESMVFPIMPDPLNGKITIASTCDLTVHERSLFDIAFRCVAMALIKTPVPEEQLLINVVITDSDEITLQIEPSGILGNAAHLVFYPVHRWREQKLTDYNVLTVIVEELCHAIWIIPDEDVVKDKVTEVIRCFNPQVTRAALYPGDTLQRFSEALPFFQRPQV